MGRLDGKVAIVTGRGSGFGMGIVQKYVEEGAKTLILDIAPGTAHELEATYPGRVKYLKGDVSSRADWEQALALTLKEFGHLDIVVNNAGILICKVRHTRIV